MKGRQGILLVLIFASFFIRHLVQAQQDQQGFVSLDCGLPTNESPYTEPKSTLKFSSDAEFIQSGTSGRVNQQDGLSKYKQYNVLRYFPVDDGLRNCYNLKVNQGTDYLIRAGFFYGNYDGLSRDPKFDMYIGPNLWTTVDSLFEDNYEIIHRPKSNSMQICLVRTGETTPMISTLELRPLRDGIYDTQSGSLRLVERSFYQSDTGSSLRYPDDVYDRIWGAYPYSHTKQINTTLSVNNSNPFEPPETVLRTAYTPINANSPFEHYVFPDSSDKFLYAYLHFAEIQALQPNDTREFDILFEENIITAAYSPKMLQIDTIHFNSSTQGYQLKLVKTKRSTLPPILNAVEIYTVMELPYSETNPDDVAALKNIQTTYGLKISSWKGDPCLPELLKWKGIECRNTNNSIPPRVISLDLSTHQLKGSIAPSLQNLTELQKL